MKASKEEPKESPKAQAKIRFGFIKSPKFYIPASIFSGIVVVGLGSVLILNPGIARGEFDLQSLVDMVLRHETKITDLEKKTEDTQNQTTTNANDITAIKTVPGTAAGTTSTSGTTNTGAGSTGSGSTTPVTPTTPPAPTEDPRTVYWDTEKHGKYSWYDLLNRQTVYIEQDQERWLQYTTFKCRFKGINTGEAEVGYRSYSQIPGLIPYPGYTNPAWPAIPPKTDNSISFVFDMRGDSCTAPRDFVVVTLHRWDPYGDSQYNYYSPGDWSLYW